VAEEAPWAPPFTPIATPSAHPKHLATDVLLACLLAIDISKRKKVFSECFRIRPVSLSLCAAEIVYCGISAA
jgi:hypothetical protein